MTESEDEEESSSQCIGIAGPSNSAWTAQSSAHNLSVEQGIEAFNLLKELEDSSSTSTSDTANNNFDYQNARSIHVEDACADDEIFSLYAQKNASVSHTSKTLEK